ncbi:hypothetical protein THAOC_26375, partial [Thalassiosira oceanica]
LHQDAGDGPRRRRRRGQGGVRCEVAAGTGLRDGVFDRYGPREQPLEGSQGLAQGAQVPCPARWEEANLEYNAYMM